MTVQDGPYHTLRMSDKLTAFRPLSPPRNLTAEVVGRLSAEIMSGAIPPGSRLPTEQAMMSSMGVSRTVVREAVAALRADGLVVTRQGVGAFVSADAKQRPFRLDPNGLESIGEVIKIMELRRAVEIEAAGLAAERGTPQQIKAIGAALEAMDAAIGRDEPAIDEDRLYHRTIAEATGNPQFVRFLEFLGHFVIPRRAVANAPWRAEGARAYLDIFQREHRAIFTAINERSPDGARGAMRRHLTNSLKRYRGLAEKAKAG
jgi:GntR family transcriptional regulator, transcriptional repressor for pyruvate dehydrogenase complex